MCACPFTATGELLRRTERSEPEAPALPPRQDPGTAALDTALPVPPGGPAAEGEVPCPYCRAFIDREVIRCPQCNRRLVGDDPLPFWVRRDCEPHRGALLQLLGVMSILLSVLTLPLALVSWGIFQIPVGAVGGLIAVAVGAAAWTMGSSDLEKMKRGEMDPTGRGKTQAGQQCGIIGVILSLTCGMGCGLAFLVPILTRF